MVRRSKRNQSTSVAEEENDVSMTNASGVEETTVQEVKGSSAAAAAAAAAVGTDEEQSSPTQQKKAKKNKRKLQHEDEEQEQAQDAAPGSPDLAQGGSRTSSPEADRVQPRRKKAKSPSNGEGSSDDFVAPQFSQELLEAEAVLSKLEEQDTVMQHIVVEKEAAYSELLKKYEALQAQRQSELDELAERLATIERMPGSGASSSTSPDVAKLQRDNQFLRAELTAVMERAKTLQRQMSVKNMMDEEPAPREESELVMEAYQLLTSTLITPKDTSKGVVHCKMVNRAAARVMEWDLDLGSEDIAYRPTRTDVGSVKVPRFLRQTLTFAPTETAQFMKQVMKVMFHRDSRE